jgi:glycine/D-amino acid oxidase-like deaminating enzyme
VILKRGIIRHALTPAQEELFLSHVHNHQDVRSHDNGCFWIESGFTIDCPRYLCGLAAAIQKQGGGLIEKAVERLSDLGDFDQIVVAAGAAAMQFPELSALRCSLLKGQVLLCQAQDGQRLPETSSIGKGYLALGEGNATCTIGSTYERVAPDDGPDPSYVQKTLFPKIAQFFPEVDRLKVVGCRAAKRVIARGHYFPIVGRVKEGLWVFTALGSRGLLYHAFVGKLLAEAILEKDPSYLCGLPSGLF